MNHSRVCGKATRLSWKPSPHWDAYLTEMNRRHGDYFSKQLQAKYIRFISSRLVQKRHIRNSIAAPWSLHSSASSNWNRKNTLMTSWPPSVTIPLIKNKFNFWQKLLVKPSVMIGLITGVGAAQRALAETTTHVIEFAVDGEDWTLTFHGLRTWSLKFKLGVEFEHEVPDGRKVNVSGNPMSSFVDEKCWRFSPSENSICSRWMGPTRWSRRNRGPTRTPSWREKWTEMTWTWQVSICKWTLSSHLT